MWPPDEIEEILTIGPVGAWSTPPTTFPLAHDRVSFEADGSGTIRQWRASEDQPSTESFRWRMVGYGLLMMDYSAAADTWQMSPANAFGIELKMQGTEFGPWPVMTSEGKSTFAHLATALAREKPPLRARGT